MNKKMTMRVAAFAAFAVCVALPLCAAELTHRWSFNGDYGDSVGGTDAVKCGAYISLYSNRVHMGYGGCTHGTGYVDLGTNMLDTAAATIEIWARHDGGRITEFVMNSVTKTARGNDVPERPVVVGDRPEDFGRCRLSPNAKPNAVVEALYAEYEPGMRRYYTANATGHARLLVSEGSVVAEFFPGSSLVPCEIFKIR